MTMAFAPNAQNHSLVSIVDKLHQFYNARDNARAARQELAAIAVDLGLDQKLAMQDAPAYLDGFLAGAGFLPKSRVEG